MNKFITIAELSRPALTPAFVAVFLALVSVYMYYLSVSVLHVVMRKEASHQTSLLTSEIASLETKYINARHTISSRLATLEGYGDANKKVFLARSEQTVVVLSDRTE